MKYLQKGYITLIEVMIIIAIILILVAIIVPACQSSAARYKAGQECSILGDPVVITSVRGGRYLVLFKSGNEKVVREELLKNCERLQK